MSETLGDALPKEVARVRDEVLPAYKAIGQPGAIASRLMEIDLQEAGRAMLSGDVVAMIRVYKSLQGWTK